MLIAATVAAVATAEYLKDRAAWGLHPALGARE
jgi:hypothetical protein